MRLYVKNLVKRAKSFRQDNEGATAVEFGILFLPFSAMLFAIIELGLVFFVNVTLSHAMTSAARDVRTGQFQTAGSDGDAFAQSVCDHMRGLGDCSNLRIDVVTSPTGRFEPDMLDPTPVSDPANPGAPPPMNPNAYVTTGPRAVVVVRAQYYQKLMFPGKYTHLANASGNVRILTAVTAFRNEPFPG